MGCAVPVHQAGKIWRITGIKSFKGVESGAHYGQHRYSHCYYRGRRSWVCVGGES